MHVRVLMRITHLLTDTQYGVAWHGKARHGMAESGMAWERIRQGIERENVHVCTRARMHVCAHACARVCVRVHAHMRVYAGPTRREAQRLS